VDTASQHGRDALKYAGLGTTRPGRRHRLFCPEHSRGARGCDSGA